MKVRGREFDMFLVAEFCGRMTAARPNSKERSETIRWFCQRTGASESTARRIYKDLVLRKKNLDEASRRKQKRKPQKTDIERARERKDALIVSSIKRMPGEKHKWIPTQRALEIAQNMGLIPQGLYTRATMDRILAREGLNKRVFNKGKAAFKLTAQYPGHVYVVDATPMDQYYLKLDGSIRRFDTPHGDKHLDDLLAREHLVKIWVYYCVDLYSKCFLAMPFANLPREGRRNAGENADDWFEFLKFFILPKNNLPSPIEGKPHPLANCPIEGLPDIIYCDKGSGIGNSKLIKNTFGHPGMGTRIVTHMPGNPSAKGMVEGRISAFKRSVEVGLIPHTINNINQLIYFYLKWADYFNKQYGFYDAWRRGIKDHPIIRVTEEDFHHASVSCTTRVISQYGTVSINNKEFFVTYDERYLHTKATIYRPRTSNRTVGTTEERYTAVLFDGTCVDLKAGIPEHDFEHFKSHPKTIGAKNREDSSNITQNIKKYITFEDTLPPENTDKIVNFPQKTIAASVELSPIAPPNFNSIESAWRWILNRTGLFIEELPQETTQAINTMLKAAYDTHHFIEGDLASMIASLIQQKKLQSKGGSL